MTNHRHHTVHVRHYGDVLWAWIFGLLFIGVPVALFLLWITLGMIQAVQAPARQAAYQRQAAAPPRALESAPADVRQLSLSKVRLFPGILGDATVIGTVHNPTPAPFTQLRAALEVYHCPPVKPMEYGEWPPQDPAPVPVAPGCILAHTATETMVLVTHTRALPPTDAALFHVHFRTTAPLWHPPGRAVAWTLTLGEPF